jgi:hypothetical protein
MIKDFFSTRFNAAMHMRLFMQMFAGCAFITLAVYMAVRLIFFDIDFDWMEELTALGKMMLVATGFAGCISTALLMADLIQYAAKKMRPVKPYLPFKKWAFTLLLMTAAIAACNAQAPVTGVVKDPATGLTSKYNILKPAKLMLMMNNEVIHHTDIPLGESFILINDGVKGLTVKNGKVSVGCSLVIKDKAGKTLLNSADLFKGNDTLDKDSASFLRCTVSTGSPMKWEEKYNVFVIFWDKYGTGKIENRVTIRCIDIP